MNLHGLSLDVHHLERWRLCTFSFIPAFVTRMQNLTVFDIIFKGFMISSYRDFECKQEQDVTVSGAYYHTLHLENVVAS